MDSSYKRGFSSVDSTSHSIQDELEKQDADKIARAQALAAKFSALAPPDDEDVPAIDDSAWVSVNPNTNMYSSYPPNEPSGPPSEPFKRSKHDSQDHYSSHLADRRAYNSDRGSRHSPPRDQGRSGGRQDDKITETIGVPTQFVGLIIGRKGDKIRELESMSGASIVITPDSEADPRARDRDVTVSGTHAQVNQAKKLIFNTWSQPQEQPRQQQELKTEIKIPSSKVGLIIGKGGQTIKEMKSESGAYIQVSPKDPSNPGAPATVTISAKSGDAVDYAKRLVEEKISQSNYQEGGGYGRGGGGRRGQHYGDSEDSYPGPYGQGNYYEQSGPPPQMMPPQDQQYYQGYADYYNQYGGQYGQFGGQYGGQYGGYPDYQNYYGQYPPADQYQDEDQ